MTAIASTAQRDTREFGVRPIPQDFQWPVAANVNCRKGGIAVVALTGADAGYVKPATAATGLVAIGRFEENFDNTGGANAGTSIDTPVGRSYVRVSSGAYYFGNSSSTDQIAQAQVGSLCFLVDDQTVAKTSNSGARSVAGIVLGVDSTLGVLVLMGPFVTALAAALLSSSSTLGLVQSGTGTLTAGVLTVSSGITVTSNSVVVPAHKVPAGTFAAGGLKCASRTAGAPGTGQIVITALKADGTTETAATGTVDYLIVG